MTTGIKLVVACVCVSFALANDPAHSQEADTAVWIAKLRGEAVKKGISGGTVDQAFQNLNLSNG